MELNCPIHKSPFVNGKFGMYCNKPLTKRPDGSVAAWCKAKPGEDLDNWEPSSKVETKTIDPQAEKTPDWDKIAEGKVRSLFVQALIQKRGLEPITQGDIDLLEGWVEYAFTGSVKTFPPAYPKEDVDQDELDKVFKIG